MFPRPLLGLLLLSSTLACAPLLPPPKPTARPVAYKGFYEGFASGLRLVAYEQPSAQRVTVDVSYRVGAADEPAGKEGIAHLMLMGLKRFSKVDNYNTKDARRRIASAALEAMQYPFQW